MQLTPKDYIPTRTEPAPGAMFRPDRSAVSAFRVPKDLFPEVSPARMPPPDQLARSAGQMVAVEEALRSMGANFSRGGWRWMGRRLAIPQGGGAFQYAGPGDWIICRRGHAHLMFSVVADSVFHHSYAEKGQP